MFPIRSTLSCARHTGWSVPGRTPKAWPVTFFRPSLRGIGLPTRFISDLNLDGDSRGITRLLARAHRLGLASYARWIFFVPAGHAG